MIIKYRYEVPQKDNVIHITKTQYINVYQAFIISIADTVVQKTSRTNICFHFSVCISPKLKHLTNKYILAVLHILKTIDGDNTSNLYLFIVMTLPTLLIVFGITSEDSSLLALLTYD